VRYEDLWQRRNLVLFLPVRALNGGLVQGATHADDAIQPPRPDPRPDPPPSPVPVPHPLPPPPQPIPEPPMPTAALVSVDHRRVTPHVYGTDGALE
jgi:hypothetical protein